LSIDNQLSDLKIRERIVKKTEYFTTCDQCDKEIVADTEARVRYQYELHVRMAHSKREEEK
jgi:hypothetical protein